MIRDAIDRIFEVARKAGTPQELLDPTGLKVRYVIDGQVKSFDAQLPPRDSVCSDIATLANFDAENNEVWYSADKIQMVDHNSGAFQDTWTMPLRKASAYEFLTRRKAYSQKAMVKGIRLNCKDELARAHPGFLTLISDLKFTTNSETTGKVTSTNDKMGRSINSEVAGAEGDLPDSLSVTVRRWAEFDIEVDLDLLVEFDMGEATIKFCPTDSSMAIADTRAADALRGLIDEEIDEATACYGSC